MSILITGAAGFLGHRLVQRLAAEGDHVVAITRRSVPAALARLPNIQWLACDIARDGVGNLPLQGIDVIVHLAGATLGAGVDEHLFLSANEATTVRLLQAVAGRVDRFVYASSQAVYGDARHRDVTEEFALIPDASAYACSKVNGENWMRCFQKRHGGQYLALRLCGFVEGGGIVDYLLDRALAGQDIELFSQGTVCRDYLAVADGVEALVAAARCRDAPGFVPVNIGSGQAVSALQLAELVCAEVGSASRIGNSTRPAPQGDFVFNINRARRMLGFDPGALTDAVRVHAASRYQRHKEGEQCAE